MLASDARQLKDQALQRGVKRTKVGSDCLCPQKKKCGYENIVIDTKEALASDDQADNSQKSRSDGKDRHNDNRTHAIWSNPHDD